MKFHVLFAALAVVCTAHSVARNAIMSPQHGFDQQYQQRAMVLNNAQCFGLARRSRKVTINIPVLYNRNTGQVSPIPRQLYSAGQDVIKMMEDQGWEVRTKRTWIPQMIYERVPVCCPWDQNCSHGTTAPPQYSPDAATPSPSASEACANGGYLVSMGGSQKCQCAPGWTGSWCQIPDLLGAVSPRFPSGPVIRGQTIPRPFRDMVREAEMWRNKVFNNQQGMQSGPLLSANDHILSAMAGPYAQQAAMWHYKMMQARVAGMQHMFRQLQNHAYGQRGLHPNDVMRAMQSTGGNPYSALGGQLTPSMMHAFQVIQHELNGRRSHNPYSGVPQEFLNPAIMSLVNQLQEPTRINPYSNMPPMQGVAPTGNPYNNIRPYVGPARYAPIPGQTINQDRGVAGPKPRTPWDLDPFQKQPNPGFMDERAKQRQMLFMTLYKRLMNNKRRLSSNGTPSQPGPYTPPGSRQQPPVPAPTEEDERTKTEDETQDQGVTPTVPNQDQQPPMDGPQDNPGMPSNDMMERTVSCKKNLEAKMCECLSGHGITFREFMNPEYMEKAIPVCQASQTVGQCIMQHDQACGEGENVLMARQMINSLLQMMGMVCQQIEARGDTPIPAVDSNGAGDDMATQDTVTDESDVPQAEDVPQSDETITATNQDQLGEQPPAQEGNASEGQEPAEMAPPMQGQQQPQMGGTMPGQPPMPSPEEIQKAQICQQSLEPKIEECLVTYDMTLQQFMNPQYMEQAKALCQDSRGVGQCIMQLDQSCGSEEQDILLTRRLINSVLQMMGMVCQQIQARGDAPVPPMPPQETMPPQDEELVPPQDMDMVPPSPSQSMPQGTPADTRTEPISEMDKPVAKPPTEHKFKPNEVQETAPTEPEAAKSKAEAPHDDAKPLSKELLLLGYPLWLIVTLALLLFVLMLLTVMVACLCLRRRRRSQKADMQKEIEKMPEPLDSKLYTLGIPPPSYTTTTVQQTEDGLVLPPLDLAENSVTIAVEDEKPPLEDADADDESDDKEDEKKETKKKEKKNSR